MDELRYGDLVQVVSMESGEVRFSPVIGFGHVDRKINITFVRVEHEAGVITLSPDHLIFVSDDVASRPYDVRGDAVKVGHFVWSVDSSKKLAASRVNFVSDVQDTGLFAPLTAESTIIVEGTAASVYLFGDHNIKHAVYGMIYRAWYFMFPGESGTLPEAGMAPFAPYTLWASKFVIPVMKGLA